MVGWNKTESTLFMLSDKQAFSLDEAEMRKRVEGFVGPDADALIKMYRSENPITARNYEECPGRSGRMGHQMPSALESGAVGINASTRGT